MNKYEVEIVRIQMSKHLFLVNGVDKADARKEALKYAVIYGDDNWDSMGNPGHDVTHCEVYDQGEPEN